MNDDKYDGTLHPSEWQRVIARNRRERPVVVKPEAGEPEPLHGVTLQGEWWDEEVKGDELRESPA